ncbi:MAG: rRNA maturation RNase YbeY [Beijerinckiaceae bacterium]
MPVVDVVIEDEQWRQIDGVETVVQQAGLLAARRSGLALRAEAEIAVLLADDAAIRTLNAQWRSKDKPTNVLSFPAVDAERISTTPMLGDIIIARETVFREAMEEGKSAADHLRHMVVHGVLHLLGYDHETDEDAAEMESLERLILAEIGVADPYAQDNEDAPLRAVVRQRGGAR